MNRIDQKFSELKKTGKKAFIAYTMAGFPSFKMSEQVIGAFISAGVDIVELGVAFSDPIMDGKSIQFAAQKALENNVNVDKILDFVSSLRKKSQISIALMSYFNPLYAYPFEDFLTKAKKAGVDGLIIPDLSYEESIRYSGMISNSGLNLIQFVAPTTRQERINKIINAADGFIYCISVAGVTGERSQIPKELSGFIQKIKQKTDKPVAVGIGISRPEQVKEIKKFADGIIVGSAFINIQIKGEKIAEKTYNLAKKLKHTLEF